MFDSIAEQVRTAVLEDEIKRQTDMLRNQLKSEFDTQRLIDEKKLNTKLSERDTEIARLREQLKSATEQSDGKLRVAVLEEQARVKDAMQAKDAQIAALRNQVVAEQNNAKIREAGLNERHASELKQKDDVISYYKDLKTRLSTKMIGESLEVHCQTLFDQAQSMGMLPNARLEKDNDARTGTKGDFIFHDYDADGVPYISIMFEMKHEMDTTATKHKNDDFLEKLDKDRRDKNCEYAVLVSLLERDNELYNNGIVNKSHIYPKMYVIRPQMFMPLISLLCQAASKNLAEISHLRSELEVARAQTIDVTNFEQRRDQFVATFGKLVEAHAKKHVDAMSGIDKVIASLEKQIEELRKVKTLFETSEQKLLRANESVENDFTIKKLTRGNPTMRAKFDEARRLNSQSPSSSSSSDE
jgi:hypothetical protein